MEAIPDSAESIYLKFKITSIEEESLGFGIDDSVEISVLTSSENSVDKSGSNSKGSFPTILGPITCRVLNVYNSKTVDLICDVDDLNKVPVLLMGQQLAVAASQGRLTVKKVSQ